MCMKPCVPSPGAPGEGTGCECLSSPWASFPCFLESKCTYARDAGRHVQTYACMHARAQEAVSEAKLDVGDDDTLSVPRDQGRSPLSRPASVGNSEKLPPVRRRTRQSTMGL